MKQNQLPHQHGTHKNLESLSEQLADIDRFASIAEIFKRLGDANRVRIFWLLCICEECVINISAILGMSSPAASHHLRSLRDSRLIVSRRAGKEVYYKASDTEESLLLQKLLKTTFKDLPV
ncbi:MAG: metalloregulator ArsR/SmtB family transcription factor [Lachnospiraceae bacterium]|nr:metalloregulator ArsR/SmtB family transcription factor [Lachnospiraceae bacterium]